MVYFWFIPGLFLEINQISFKSFGHSNSIKYYNFYDQPNLAGEGRPGARDRLRDGHGLRIPLRRGYQRSMGRFWNSGRELAADFC